MLKRLFTVIAILLFPCVVCANHHFDSILAKQYPQFDITGIYVFKAHTKGFTVFAMAFNPLVFNNNNVKNFSQSGLYNMHISFDKNSFSRGKTLTFAFKGNVCRVGEINSSNAPVGKEGSKLGLITIGKTHELEHSIRVWTGAVHDPFFADRAGFKRFVEGIVNSNKYLPDSFSKKGTDYFANKYVSGIVLEIPNKQLAKRIYFYTTAALYSHGRWHQVNRSANVLLPNLFLFDSQNKIDQDITRPNTDKDRIPAVRKNIMQVVRLNHSHKDIEKYANKTAHELLPDVIEYQIGTPAKYSITKPNGRKITDNAADVALTAFAGTKLSDGVNYTHNYQQHFPYFKPANFK